MRASLLTLLLFAASACGSAPAPVAKPQSGLATSAPTSAPAGEATPAPAQGDDLEARLGYLDAQLKKALDEQHIPGISVVVVRGDDVIFQRGYGVRSLDSKEPVTEETIFAIGSSTKAMTATTLAMLVGEGKLGWDDPVDKHLPELTLAVDADKPGDRATVRDLLSHQTGFPRMSLLWASGKLDRSKIFALASKAKPNAKLRKAWQYNNVQYMAAGEIAGRVSGSSWSDVIKTRLFEPLGMTSSHTLSSAADADPQRAAGYTWWKQDNRHETENHRILDNIGPAGSVYSNARDMSKWLRFLVAGGAVADKRLVDETALAETQTPQAEIGPGMQYGMGWMLRDIGGHRVVEHGGNIDGYAASVGFFPKDGVGYAILTNSSSHALQGSAAQLMFDALVGDGYRQSEPAVDLSLFAGKYEADMGPLAGQFLTVAAKGSTLTVDVPGQMVFELRPPNEEGKWVFAMTNTIAVSFVQEGDEPATAMRLHQAGFDFELPRENSTFAVVVDADRAAPLVGRYQSKEDPKQGVEVELYRGRLTVAAPGPLKLQLDEPAADAKGDEAGRWQVRARRGDYVTFEMADGKAVAIEMHSDGNSRRLERDPTARVEPARMADVTALRKPSRRAKALARAGLIIARGKMSHPQAGITGDVTMYSEGTDHYRLEIDYGELGSVTTVSTPGGSWESSDFDQAVQHDGLRRQQAVVRHPLALHGDWKAVYADVKLARTEQKGGKRVHRLTLEAGDLPTTHVEVDGKTGDVVAMRSGVVASVGVVPASSTFEDFRKVGGLRLPFRIVTDEFQSGESVLTFDRIRTRQRKRPGLFPAKLPE